MPYYTLANRWRPLLDLGLAIVRTTFRFRLIILGVVIGTAFHYRLILPRVSAYPQTPPRFAASPSDFNLLEKRGNSSNDTQAYSLPTEFVDFDQCKARINSAPIPGLPPVYVDWNGNIVDNTTHPELVKGVTAETCYAYCGSGSAQPTWSLFSQQFTSWLLPFLALTAQFPFEGETTWDNFMSAFLNIGSPALGMYSLVVTLLSVRVLYQECRVVLNWDWLNKRGTFNRIEEEKKAKVKEIIERLAMILAMGKQEPFTKIPYRPNQVPKGVNEKAEVHFLELSVLPPARDTPAPSGSHSSETDHRSNPATDSRLLKRLHEDEVWCKDTYSMVGKMKRGYTASFVHQLLWANIAFIFTVVDAFGADKMGSTVTAFGLAISLIWQWETPLVIGWVLTGTQTVAYAVSEAIREIDARDMRSRMAENHQTPQLERKPEFGKPESETTTQPMLPEYREQVVQGKNTESFVSRDSTPNIAPTTFPDLPHPRNFFIKYNPDRSNIASVEGDKALPGPVFNYARVYSWSQRLEAILYQYKLVIDPSLKPLDEYMTHEGKSRWRRRATLNCIFASLLGLLLQWATSGASIFLDWETPTIGLGCRSGGVLIYAVVATLIWALLAGSAYLSEVLDEDTMPEDSWSYRLICFLGISLRILGKFLAIVNTVWLLVHCFFEFTNYYENCWCKGDVVYFGRQHGYWIWESDLELRMQPSVGLTWAGATIMGVLVPAVFVGFFGVARHHYGLD